MIINDKVIYWITVNKKRIKRIGTYKGIHPITGRAIVESEDGYRSYHSIRSLLKVEPTQTNLELEIK